MELEGVWLVWGFARASELDIYGAPTVGSGIVSGLSRWVIMKFCTSMHTRQSAMTASSMASRRMILRAC